MSGRKLILFYVPALNAGGAQRVMVNLANFFGRQANYDVLLVVSQAGGEFDDDVDSQVVRHVLNRGRVSSSIPSLSRLIKEVQPWAVVSRMWHVNIATTLAWLLAGRAGKLVLSEAAVLIPPADGYWQSLRYRVKLALLRFFYPFADTVVANSHGTAKSLVAADILSGEQITIIGNPVLSESSHGSWELSSPECPGAWAARRYLSAVGRLDREKGFDLLIRALSLLEDSDLHLVIAGEGPQREELEALVNQLGLVGRVHMPGFMESPACVIQNSELFVLSSRCEGFGNVLVEALATGVPIVSTDCPGGPRDILCDGRLGHLVSPGSADALAVAISDAQQHPRGECEARMARARDFSIEHVAREYERLALEGVDS